MFNAAIVKRAIALVSAAALSWATIPVASARADTPPVLIDIAAINDFHGRIVADQQSAGAAVVACAVDAVRAANPNTLFVASGDLIGASTFESSVAGDVPTINVLNAMKLRTSALGNHEFDKGAADLNNRVIPQITWSYTSANLYRGGSPAYPQYDILDADGVKVAFIGATTQELGALVSPDGIAGLDARDITASVNAVVKQLSDGDAANGEADVFIVLVHDGAASADLGAASATPYGKLITNIDPKVSAILSGHTHQVYAQQVKDAWVLQSAQYGEQLGRVSLSYDTATKKATVTKAWNQDLVDKNNKPVCSGDPAIQSIVDKAVKDADALGARPIGQIQADFLRALNGGRATESTIGNFIADVQLWAAQSSGAQVALMNPGGIRTDLAYAQAGGEGDGVVTFKEAALVQPFANTIVVSELTGAQLKTVLEQQWQPAGSSRPFLKLGVSAGLHYVFDPAAPTGARITSMTLNGKAIKPTDTIKVAANSFLMAGGDAFTEFKKGSKPVDTGWVDLDAMVEYFKQKSPSGSSRPVAPDYVQRSVAVTVAGDITRTLVPGDEIVIDVAGLSFTNNEPKPTTVTATIGGVVVGTFTVDNTYVDRFDLTGSAKVRVKVPAGVTRAATSTLVLSDNVNGIIWSSALTIGAAPVRPMPETGADGADAGVLVLVGLLVSLGCVASGRGFVRRPAPRAPRPQHRS